MHSRARHNRRPMHHTIFDTPIVNEGLRQLCVAVLRAKGWTLEGGLPAGVTRCVVIAAPHTSNWDLPYTLAVAFALRLNIFWMGKQQLFRWPFRGVMMWLGGVPVNREQNTNLVAASAQALRDAGGPMQLVVPPEGTRSKARYWKTGFYYIALQAQVPIVLGYMDYQRKRSGLGPAILPSGDIERDMLTIKAFYAEFTGRNADQF